MVIRRARNKTLRLSRDTVLFVVGLLGIAYETIIEGGDKPTLLVMFGAMVGLPAFLRGDEKAQDKAEKQEVEDDEALATPTKKAVSKRAPSKKAVKPPPDDEEASEEEVDEDEDPP